MTADDIPIRPFEAVDLQVLQKITIDSFSGVALDEGLEQRFGRWTERTWQERKADHIADDVAANPTGVFVAESEGIILGYITTRVDHLNSRGRIPNLAVVDSARGLGLGRRLIQHALDYFRAEGLQLAQIETMASNPIGQHLYPSCGFEEVARQVHYAMRL